MFFHKNNKATEEDGGSKPMPEEPSLERILDELDKRDQLVHVRSKIKRKSAPIIAITKPTNSPLLIPARTALISQNEYYAISSDNRRGSRQLLAHKVFMERPSGFVVPRSNILPPPFPSSATRKVNYPNSEDEVRMFHARRLSSPNVIGPLQSQSKLSGVASTTSGSNINSPLMEPRFNISYPIRPSNQNNGAFSQSPSSNIFMGSPKPAYPQIAQIYVKTDNSPRIMTINNDYLLKAFSNRASGSEVTHIASQSGGSIMDSPKSVITANGSEFRTPKRGSFSVFRKIVEAELSSKLV